MQKFTYLAFIFLFSFSLMACSQDDASSADTPQIQTLDNGLIIETLEKGSGDVTVKMNNIRVHYTGTLTDGTKFDSSLDRGQPFAFTLGGGQVIRGWDEGLIGMQVGEKRKLTIPSDLAYGDKGIGPIPANSTLIFDVELMEIVK